MTKEQKAIESGKGLLIELEEKRKRKEQEKKFKAFVEEGIVGERTSIPFITKIVSDQLLSEEKEGEDSKGSYVMDALQFLKDDRKQLRQILERAGFSVMNLPPSLL